MSWLDRLRGAARAPGERTTGLPTSSNQASSAHLWWRWDGPAPDLVEVSVTFTVVERPVVERLHFWALQASFVEGRPPGRRHGGGHTGLQLHPGHPGGTAVNWGGYGADGRELEGSVSPLPSALGNPNTRDLHWDAGRPYRLSVHRGNTGWAASVDGLIIRDLHVGGDRLTDVVMWSEVFARCDDPSSAVRWSDPSATTRTGSLARPVAVEARYQTVADGGCSNSNSELVDDGGIIQRTNVARTTRPGTILPLR